MELRTYSKINLTLEVAARRPDGYHNLETVFWPVTLCDELLLTPRTDGELVFSCVGLPASPENLVCRAYRLLEAEAAARGRRLPGLTAELRKKVPSEAGLGGGSGDAAAMLQGVNELFPLGFSTEMLAAAGARLGADVPALLYRGPTRGRGTGTEVKPLRAACGFSLIIVKPAPAFPTPQMYRAIDLARSGQEAAPGGPPGRSTDRMEQALLAGDRAAVYAGLVNDFESVVPEPACLAGIKENLLAAGAGGALLSGSGSSVFGLFGDRAARDEALERLRSLPRLYPGDPGCRIFAAETLCGDGSPYEP